MKNILPWTRELFFFHGLSLMLGWCACFFPVQEESHSTPALLTAGGPNVGNSAMSLGIIPEHSLLESCARLSVSLEGPGIFAGTTNQSSCSSSLSGHSSKSGSHHHMTMEELRAVNRYAESTKSLSYLPQVIFPTFNITMRNTFVLRGVRNLTI